MLSNGISLMISGMSFVFVFLAVMIFCIYGMAMFFSFFSKYFKDEPINSDDLSLLSAKNERSLEKIAIAIAKVKKLKYSLHDK